MNCSKPRGNEARARQSKYDIRRCREKQRKAFSSPDCHPLFTLAHVIEPVLDTSRLVPPRLESLFEKCSRKRAARILRAEDPGSAR